MDDRWKGLVVGPELAELLAKAEKALKKKGVTDIRPRKAGDGIEILTARLDSDTVEKMAAGFESAGLAVSVIPFSTRGPSRITVELPEDVEEDEVGTADDPTESAPAGEPEVTQDPQDALDDV